MSIIYVTQKSKSSHKKGINPYSKRKMPSPHLQGVLKRTEPFHRTTEFIPSHVTTGYASCSKSEDKKYTGSNIIGIGTMHKSNAVPIFNDNQAKDLATMRRG